ncbi:MAG TPA: F0F1 ATP synthase subunit A [Patescibacteria group bacterium]|nr:F0F1 ATP synthase subunit A [Patescibacteria group bacterium]
MAAEVAGQVAGAEHAEGAFNAGDHIFRHVVNSQHLELPFVGEVTLPTLHIGPLALPITKSVVMMWVASAILLLFAWLITRRRNTIPGRAQSLFEILVVFVRDDLARKNIGEHGDRYVPYLLTTFFFILTCNYLGLLPYASNATANINVTAALALIAFVMIQAAGIREYGVVHHFKNMVPSGVPMWLMPIMIPVEIMSMVVKPIALCLRLFANMTAGHLIIVAFITMVFILKSVLVGVFLSVPFALFINLIELLVAFLQAYIFTMLTSLFIGMSAHPAH